MSIKRPTKLSEGEEEFALQCRAVGIHMEREAELIPGRKWRFDFCNRSRMVICEVNGGNRLATIGRDGKPYAVGRHTLDEDYRKMNAASLLGYRIYVFTPAMVKSGEAITMMLQEQKRVTIQIDT